MKLALALFWRRTWDNLGHIVLVNLIWFVLVIPLFYSLYNAINAFYPRQSTVDQSASEVNMEDARAAETANAVSTESGLDLASTGDSPSTAKRGAFRWSAQGATALVLVTMAWVVMCTGLGFVFYATADIVTEHDFSGYKFIFRSYLRRGPVLKSITSMTFFTATLLASLANMAFYLAAAQSKGPVFLILAGIMLWFILFLSMTGALTMPVMAQRDLRAAYETDAAAVADDGSGTRAAPPADTGLWKCVRTAAVLALSAPLATLVMMVMAFFIVFVGLWSMAGMGFFAVAAPAALFNAYVFVQLGGTVRWSPAEGASSLYGTAN